MSTWTTLATFAGGSAGGAIVNWALGLRASRAAARRALAADAAVARDTVVEEAVEARRQLHEEAAADRQALRTELNDTRDRLARVEERLDGVTRELSVERASRETLVVAAKLCTRADICPVLAAAQSIVPSLVRG